MVNLTPAQAEAENEYKKHKLRSARLFDHFLGFVDKAGIKGGKLVEIGGRENPIKGRKGVDHFDYVAFDLEQSSPDVVVADITHCPQIPNGYADVVFTIDVFEHINRPWRAASEITRILKPGGIVYTSTLFSWRYHPCPIDYWRYTPACLTFLFEHLETLAADFDTLERRRNVIGKNANKVAEDAFGGWRENWRVFHVGRKPK